LDLQDIGDERALFPLSSAAVIQQKLIGGSGRGIPERIRQVLVLAASTSLQPLLALAYWYLQWYFVCINFPDASKFMVISCSAWQ
jgi:hypothetical protein